jgi:WD40 repeat protein
MGDKSAAHEESLPLSQELRIDAVCRTFEAAWKAVDTGGTRPRLEDYLAAEAAADRWPLLRELLKLELHYGQGEPLCADELARRFPEYAEQLPSLVLAHPPVPESDHSAGDTPPELPREGREPTAPRAELPSVPGHEVLGELGRGGMGVVYRARHIALNRPVALKMIRAGALAGDQEVSRFRAEAEAVARLQHPNIVQVYEVGEQGGLPYFSLEFCAGGDLATRLGGAPVPAVDAAEVVETLARAMHAAHQAGVVHRDLKPANVLLVPQQPAALDPGPAAAAGVKEFTLKITDFGLAKRAEDVGQTPSGAILGTPSYMAPEQAGGQPKAVGPRSDVYALGAILYELLTGRPPFRAATPVDTLLQVISEEPVPPRLLQPKVPRDLEAVCLTCLEKDPARRYRSAEALANDLGRFRQGLPTLARPVGALERGWKWARRRPAAAGLFALGIVTLGALIALAAGLHYGAQVEAERNEAQVQRGLAEAARDEADKAKGEVQEQKAEVEKQRDLVRRTSYTAHTNLAAAAWQVGDIRRMLFLLEEQRPERTGGEDLRGWEWHYLWRLCHSDLLTLKVNPYAINCVCFSPDGLRLASSTIAGEVKVWDAQTGQEQLTLKGHTGKVYSTVFRVCFSPDGKRLASAGGYQEGGVVKGEVKVWDAQTGQEQLTLKGHAGWVNSVCFSPDGQRLVSASSHYDQQKKQGHGEVKVWDAQTGREALSLEGSANCACFSPDGKRLVSASTYLEAVPPARFWPPVDSPGFVVRGEVKVWDAQTGQEARTLKVKVTSLCFSPDGRRLAGTADDGTAKVWDAQTWEEQLLLKAQNASISSVCFSPDGRRLAGGGGFGDHTVKVWDAQTGKEQFTLQGHTGAVESVCFSPDGQRLASASTDKTVKVWDAQMGQEARTVKERTIYVESVCFSPDGRRLAGGGGFGDDTVKVWDAQTGEDFLTLQGHTGPVIGVCFSPDGRRLASASWGGAQVWDAKTGKEEFSLEGHTGHVLGVCFSPDGKRMATASADGTAKVWDAQTGQELRTLKGHTWPLTSVCFSPDGRRLASASGGEKDSVDGEVKVWDAQTGQEERTLRGHSGNVLGVCFSPDGTRLASASEYGTVKVWDAQTGQEQCTLWGHTMPVRSVCFSPDGQRLASASRDGTVKVWDLRTGQEILTLKGHTSWVESVCFSPDGTRLVSSSLDGTVKVWDAQRPPPRPPPRKPAAAPGANLFEPQPIKRLGGEFVAKGFRSSWSPDGLRMAFARPDDRHGDVGGGIAVIDLGSAKVTGLTRSGKDPVWAPGDGRLIAYVAGGLGEQEEVWLIPSSGGDPRKIAPGGFPSWSADGKTLFFHSRTKRRVLAADPFAEDPSRTLREVLSTPYYYPALSPDGKRFALQQGRRMGVVEWESGKTVGAWPLPPGQGMLAAWSPDGKRIAFGGWGAHDPSGLWVLQLDTGEAVRVLSGTCTMPAWSPDGTRMSFDLRLATGSQIWVIDTKVLDTLPRVKLAEK